MHLLLLGANGQLGSDICRLSQKQKNVTLTAWTREQLDITNLSELTEKLSSPSFDALINCTSYHKTDEVESHADKAFLMNAFAVREMAKVCHAKKARFIHVSTDYVFGGSIERQPLLETNCPAPLNVYGASKLTGEKLAFANHDDVTIFRVASLFGVAGASGKGGNFVETMIRLAKEKGKISVVNDQTMSPTSTADIADSLFKFLSVKGATGTYHVVNSGQATWCEFAKKIIELAKINATVEPILSSQFPTPAKRPSYSVLNNQKISEVVGKIAHWEVALVNYLKEKVGV